MEARRVALRRYLDDLPRPEGIVAVSDDVFMEAIEKMRGLYPPVPLRTPSGEVVVESPWIVMLGLRNRDGKELVAGADDVLHRIELVRAKTVGGE